MSRLPFASITKSPAFGLALGLALLSSLACGQEADRSAPAQFLKTVEPFLQDSTFLVVRVDATRLALPDDTKLQETLAPAARASYTDSRQELANGLHLLKKLSGGQPVYLAVAVPHSREMVPIHCFRRAAAAGDTATVKSFLLRRFRTKLQVRGDYLVATNVGKSALAKSPPPKASLDAFQAAFAAVEDYPLQLMVVPPEHVWRTVEELSPQLPPQLGGGSSKVLTEGVQWIAVGVDPSQLKIEMLIQSDNNEAATRFAAHLPKLLGSVDKAAGVQLAIPEKFTQFVSQQLKPKAEGSQVAIRINGSEKTSVNLTMLTSLAELLDEELHRYTNLDKFRNIVLGMHNYHDVYRAMPPNDKHRDKEGKPRLSWRVHILPFVEQSELYQQFRLNEPWDSPHNKQLIDKMPDIFARRTLDPTHSSLKPGHTTFLAPAGEKTIFGGNKPVRFRDMLDGTSNTIALVEVKPEKAVPWTAPQDYQFDPKDPLAGVRVGKDKRWLSAFADGSVRQAKSSIDAKTLLNLFQMSDGNVIDYDKLR